MCRKVTMPASGALTPVATSWLIINTPQVEVGTTTQMAEAVALLRKASISRGTRKRSVARRMALPTERMDSQSSTKTSTPSSHAASRVRFSPLQNRAAMAVKPWMPPEASNSATRLPKKPHTSTSQIHRSLPITPYTTSSHGLGKPGP